MKKPLLLTFLLAAAASNAQMTTGNEPVIGDNVDMYVVDSFATNYAGVTGSGVTWDYSTIAGYNGTTQTVEILDPVNEPFASDFAGATKVISVGGTLKTYFSSTANDRTSQGFHMNEASLGDVLVKYDVDPLLMVNYPFDFGTTMIDDTYDGNLSLTFNGIPVNETLTGVSHASIDGQGTLLFPNGISATNVLRYYSADTAATTLPILGAVDVIKNQYEYYDYATQNLPIFMHVSIIIVPSGGTTPITETHLVLSKYDGLNVSVNEIAEIDFTLAPNPTEGAVKVFGAFSAEATGQLLDQSGRVLSTFDVQSGQAIDMEGLTNGMYLIAISDNGVTTTKTIMKK